MNPKINQVSPDNKLFYSENFTDEKFFHIDKLEEV